MLYPTSPTGTAQSRQKRFREAFSPSVLQMEFRLAELENPLRQHGIKLGDVADRKATVGELKRASLVARAQSYRRRFFSEFDRAKEVRHQSQYAHGFKDA